MRIDSRRSTGILSVIFIFILILSACGEGEKIQNDSEAPAVSESTDQEEASASEPAEEPQEEASASEPAEEPQEEASASEPAEEPQEEASASEPADESQQVTPFQGDCTSSTVGTLINPDEWFYLPGAGSVVAVVGVEHWDILEIHEDPGVSSPLVGTLDPLDDTVVALGYARQLPQSIWWCISWNGGSGAWASSIYLSRMADPYQSFDSSSWVGLTAQNLEDFLSDVESQYQRPASSEGGPMRIVISELDYINNVISIDVIGFVDDSLLGARLTFSTSLQSDGSLIIDDAQFRAMCRRGGGPGSDLCL